MSEDRKVVGPWVADGPQKQCRQGIDGEIVATVSEVTPAWTRARKAWANGRLTHLGYTLASVCGKEAHVIGARGSRWPKDMRLYAQAWVDAWLVADGYEVGEPVTFADAVAAQEEP